MVEPESRSRRRTRTRDVRVIGPDGEQLGVLPLHEALRRAQDAGLDLVEIDPLARPALCKILDHGKLRYEQKKEASAARKAQVLVLLKEVKLRPGTREHDYEVKLRRMRAFLTTANRVLVTLTLRGRELTRPEPGQEMLRRVMEDLEEIAVVESAPRREGRTVSMVLAPAGTWRPPRPPGVPQQAVLRSQAR